MFRAPVPLRYALAAATLIALPALPAASAGAQTVTLNFNSLTDPGNVGVRTVPNCYTELGYSVTVVGVPCGDPNALATGGPASPLIYTGSPALFLNDATATLIDFAQVGGGLFSFQSIQFAPFLGANTTVTLTGFRGSVAAVFASALVPGSLVGLQTFAPTGFTGLSSLRLTALDEFGEPIVQFDNVTFSGQVTATPEPATFGLVFIGLIGMGAVVRRRRAA